MKLFLITRPPNTVDWDEWISAIVCCNTEDEARMTHPNPNRERPWNGESNLMSIGGDWCAAAAVIVKEIGLAHPSIKRGVVLDSFNAG